MTKNLPLRKMHFMAQRVRAAEQAMQRKAACGPLHRGFAGGIPHDVQDFLRPPIQTAVLSAAGFYNFCAEELLPLRMPTGEEAGAGQPIYDRPAWGGMAVPIPAAWNRRLYGAKKRDRHPLSGMPISFL